LPEDNNFLDEDMEKKIKLLILTQKVDINDDVLGFMHGWIAEFAKYCEKVTVVALGVGEYHLPENVKVLSLGKDLSVIHNSPASPKTLSQGGLFTILKKIGYAFRFYNCIWSHKNEYDHVFVHMNSEYVVLGGWLWRLLGKKIGLWYAHGYVPFSLKIAEKFCDAIFTSTKTGCRLDSKKIKVIGQGIDIKKFSPPQELKDSVKFKIITVGRISPVKDYETFLNALEILLADNSVKEKIEVKIIGGPGRPNQESYFQKLKEIVIKKGLSKQVEFLGVIPFVEIDKYLKEADLMVNSSLTGSLDKTMVEAMACGVPVISCNEALAEILDNHYREELIYSRGNFKQLAEKIDSILKKSQVDRQNIGRDLRRVVVENHSLEKFTDKILASYRKKIKILFAINNLSLGGAEVLVAEQLKNIDQEKFEPVLVNLYPSKKTNLLSEIDFLGKNFISFDSGSKNPFNIKKWLRSFSLLKREKFDVIYTHLFECNLIFRSLAFFFRVPVILSFEHSQYSGKSRWQIWCDRMLSKITDKIIVATEAVAEFTCRQERIPSEKFYLIPNPVVLPDRNEINLAALKREINFPEKSFIVATMGRYAEEKGQIFLLQAAEILKKEIPDIKFILVGYGYLEKWLLQEIKERKLEDTCHLLVEPKRAKEFLYIADIFALPSLREGQSIVTYEALAAGLPVLASAISGPKDIIKEGYNGFLFPIGDEQTLSEKIAYFYKNRSELETMSVNARSSVKNFTINYNLEKLSGLIEKLLMKNNGANKSR